MARAFYENGKGYTEIDRAELAWAAGLFEGEGCITHGGHNHAYLLPKLVLCSADEDVVRRFYMAIGEYGRIRIREPKEPQHKRQFEWIANGFELVQAIIALLWFGLNRRRRDRAREILGIARRARSMPDALKRHRDRRAYYRATQIQPEAVA